MKVDCEDPLYHFKRGNTVKRKPVFRIGTILLSAGLVMSTMNIATDRFVMAEEMPIVEKEENSDIVSGAFEDQDAAGASDLQDDLEILDSGELTEDQTEAADAQDISSGIEIESETEAITEMESESEQEKLLLASVRLELDSDLETVPAAFSEYLKDVPVYSVILVYSDGSEKLLDQEDERYELSVEYEDTSDADEMVRRTYHAVLKEYSTGNVFEDTQYIDFGTRDPVEIKTEEMTTVILEGRKKWIMVQAVPSVTGRYAMNSDKSIEEIYYVADDGEVVRTEDVLKLQQGISYQFLIKLS